MNNATPPEPRIQSVSRAVAILLEVARHDDGISALDLARELGINRATTYHLVQTLTAERFLVRTAARRYKLGLRIGVLARAFPRQLDASERLLPYARRLATTTGETAFAAELDAQGVIVLAHVPGQHPVHVTASVGLTEDAHARAAGKLLLAGLTPARRAGYLSEHPLRPRTPATIVDPDAFEREMGRVREQGYAVDREEFETGVCCLAVPLDGGRLPYVLAVQAPTHRFEANERHYLEATVAAADDALVD